ncbi:hypothetical protein A0H81_06927 [Grifola frondosa]|uniref:Uncharacterized protein n=1 Tax=Grifola frondosa TaxID=5627 RepID=A0A1C7M963_GRIFR|nr:hypothetical protein A0H81_06927 [Grifola frondosa]
MIPFALLFTGFCAIFSAFSAIPTLLAILPAIWSPSFDRVVSVFDAWTGSRELSIITRLPPLACVPRSAPSLSDIALGFTYHVLELESTAETATPQPLQSPGSALILATVPPSTLSSQPSSYNTSHPSIKKIIPFTMVALSVYTSGALLLLRHYVSRATRSSARRPTVNAELAAIADEPLAPEIDDMNARRPALATESAITSTSSRASVSDDIQAARRNTRRPALATESAITSTEPAAPITDDIQVARRRARRSTITAKSEFTDETRAPIIDDIQAARRNTHRPAPATESAIISTEPAAPIIDDIQVARRRARRSTITAKSEFTDEPRAPIIDDIQVARRSARRPAFTAEPAIGPIEPAAPIIDDIQAARRRARRSTITAKSEFTGEPRAPIIDDIQVARRSARRPEPTAESAITPTEPPAPAIDDTEAVSAVAPVRPLDNVIAMHHRMTALLDNMRMRRRPRTRSFSGKSGLDGAPSGAPSTSPLPSNTGDIFAPLIIDPASNISRLPDHISPLPKLSIQSQGPRAESTPRRPPTPRYGTLRSPIHLQPSTTTRRAPVTRRLYDPLRLPAHYLPPTADSSTTSTSS